MLRPLLICLAITFALPPLTLRAQCAGLNFWDVLSDPQQAELMQKAEDTPYGTGLFWSATKGDTSLSIMGTMHLRDDRHIPLLARAGVRLANADLLLVEATLDDQTAMQTHMAQNPDLMTLNDGTTLPERLDPATWDAVRDAASSRGLPSFMAAKMQPWFLSMTLSIPPCAMTAMMAGDAGLDNMIMQAAMSRGVPIAPLEPWQDMFALLSSGTLDEQLNALELSLMDPWLQDAMIVALSDFYFEERTAISWLITDYTLEFLPNIDADLFRAELAKFEKALLTDRNRNWIPVIEQAAEIHHDIFVAFGAAHLFGEDGVMNLLAENGWTITAID